MTNCSTQYEYKYRRNLLYYTYFSEHDTSACLRFVMGVSLLNVKTTVQWRIWGAGGTGAPSDPKSLHFHAVFRKIGQMIGWRPPLGFPPLGNPGSATADH